jgi:hypothetical protein
VPLKLLSKQLALPLSPLLTRWLGKEVGSRHEFVQMCAALSSQTSSHRAEPAIPAEPMLRCGADNDGADNDGGCGGHERIASGERVASGEASGTERATGGGMSAGSQRFVMVEPKWKATHVAGAAHGAGPPHMSGSMGGGLGDRVDGSVGGGEQLVHVVQCGDGGAITQWRDGACLYVNAGRYRNGPSARYRNRFWRDSQLDAVLMSWFPGRGHTVTGAAVARLLCDEHMSLLLLCRRAPSQPYYLCGRLQPVGVATAQTEGTAVDAEGATPTALRVWPTVGGEGDAAAAPAAHVIFRLLDVAALCPPHEDVMRVVLGGREIEPCRPDYYC